MNKFQVGDIVSVCVEGNYSITDKGSTGEVLSFYTYPSGIVYSIKFTFTKGSAGNHGAGRNFAIHESHLKFVRAGINHLSLQDKINHKAKIMYERQPFFKHLVGEQPGLISIMGIM